MAPKLKTTMVALIAVAAVLAVTLQWLLVQRVVGARDLQQAAVDHREQVIEMQRLFLLGTLQISGGDRPDRAWFEQLEVQARLLGCCEREIAALAEAVAKTPLPLNVADFREEAEAVISATDAFLERDTEAYQAVLETNRATLPWIGLAGIAVIVLVVWLIIRQGVLQPIEGLMHAVERSKETGRFQFKIRGWNNSEVADLAETLTLTIDELQARIRARDGELSQARSEARAESQRMAQELAELVDGASSPIFTLDGEGVIRTWNRQLHAMTGIPGLHTISRPLESFFQGATDRKRFQLALRQAMTGESTVGMRVTLMTVSDPVDLLVDVSPRRSSTGAVVGVTCVGHPLSDFIEQTAEELERQRARHFSELAAGAAHQFNQPLQKMRLYLANVLNRVRKGTLEPALLIEKLHGIDQQVTRLSEIAEHLREFGRKQRPIPGGFSLSMVVERCVDLNRAAIEDAGVVLQLDNALPTTLIPGHPLSVERALLALLNNAREALLETRPDLPCIEVRAYALEGEAAHHIVVRDNGGGVPDGILGRVFDPFFTSRTNSRNVGLGLSTARALLEELGGDINLESQGEFTEVVCRIPLANGTDTESLA